MYQYCLFDLDGTLTDPREGITKCVQYALHHYGIEEPDLTKLEAFIGPPLADSFMQFYGFPEQKPGKPARYTGNGLFLSVLMKIRCLKVCRRCCSR